ncbi:MAG: hypothetical protein ICV66_10930, partial [Chitinophagaceae bacterium]|nr:hypothetical protein [Chitinophagaceae bacterium]
MGINIEKSFASLIKSPIELLLYKSATQRQFNSNSIAGYINSSLNCLHNTQIMKYNLFLAALFFIFSTNAQQKLMGFKESNAAKQLDWEKQF